MAWIESHQELWRHPKTKKLARLLSVSVPTAIGHLHGLWFWALDFAQDGDIGRYDPEEIADAVLWDGNAQEFIDALIGSGFADKTPESITIHDWNEYAGKLLERRAADRQRKRSSAKTSPSSAGIPPEVNGKAKEFSRIPSLPYPTVPNSTEPSKGQKKSAGKPPRPHFVPPTVDEVSAYCTEKGYHVEPSRFVDFYTANGWKQGKEKPIVDWKAAVRTWEQREKPKETPEGGGYGDVV